MNTAGLINFVRDQTQVSSDNVTDATILNYLNIAYHKLENVIADRVDEDYFWDIFTTDLVENQAEYVLKNSTSTQAGIKKINRVEIKYTDEDEYYSLIDADALSNYKIAYDNLQETDIEFYEFRDGSVFINPLPIEDIPQWLRVHAIQTLIDLAVDGEETTIFPNHTELRQYHYIIAMWAIPFIERHRNIKDKNNVNNSAQMYNVEVDMMIQELNSKDNEPIEWVLPSHNYY